MPKAKLTCTCSLHGKQKISGFVFAGIRLECGCVWVKTSSGIEYDGNRNKNPRKHKPAPAGGE